MVNKIAICDWVQSVPGPSALEVAATLGFQGVQIGDLGGATKGFPMNNKYVQKMYLDAAKEHNIIIQSLHLYTLLREETMQYPINSEKGKLAKKSLKMGIEACAEMDIPVIMINPAFAYEENETYTNILDMLKYACQVGRENGVVITMECAGTLDRIHQMRDIVGPDLKLCYDTLNPLRFGFGEDPPGEIRALGTEIIDHIHLKDAPRRLFHSEARGCCPLGEGDCHFKESVQAIKDIGFDGWLVSENYYDTPPMNQYGDFMEMAAQDVKSIKDFFDL